MASTSSSAASKSALILGGNGMMGAEIVLALAAKGYTITSLNRGAKPWDFADRVLPRIKQNILCNRKHLEQCTELTDLLAGSSSTFFDLVVDCSGYHGDWVEETASMLQGKAGLYVYISTDSVYEVCVPAAHEDGLSVEEDAVRPSTREEVKAMKKKDSYGHAKLRGEEALQRQFRREEDGSYTGIPFVSLRLADVIGPRDATDRWLLYQAWVLSHDLLGPPLVYRRKLERRPLSFVFSLDVANLIPTLPALGETIYGEAYNLAFAETVTVRDLIEEMAHAMRVSELVWADSEASAAAPWYYPSVERGPISVAKAQRVLGWDPTPFKQAVAVTCAFYTQAIAQRMSEAMEVVEDHIKSHSMRIDSYGFLHHTQDRIDKANAVWAASPHNPYRDEL